MCTRTGTYDEHVRRPKTNDARSEQTECETKMASSDTYVYTYILCGHEKKGAGGIGGKTQHNAVEKKNKKCWNSFRYTGLIRDTFYQRFIFFFFIQYLADHCTNLRARSKNNSDLAPIPPPKTLGDSRFQLRTSIPDICTAWRALRIQSR
jgi:hypothetical protein